MSTTSGTGPYDDNTYAGSAYGTDSGYTEGSHVAGASSVGSSHQSASYDDVSIGDRISAITADFSTLMRQEIALAKAEAMESGKKAGAGAGMLGGAGVAAHLMLIFVSLAAAWGLASLGMGLGWGALIVGIIWGVVAAVLALTGKKKFENLGMPQTVDTAQRIPTALKGNETR